MTLPLSCIPEEIRTFLLPLRAARPMTDDGINTRTFGAHPCASKFYCCLQACN
jgi:hypothetical protein